MLNHSGRSRPTRRTRSALIGAAIVSLAIAAGCAGDDADNAAADGTEDADAPNPTATADGANDGDTPAPNGTIRSSPSISLVTLDPHNFIGGGLSWLTPVYEPLFRQVLGDEENIEPMLATGYDIDGLTITIELRDDVEFTDGEPFNADAVKANLERGKEIGVRPEFAPIDTVTAVDDHTVEIALSEPSPGFIADMATIPGLMISPAALDSPTLDRNPIGTGPYVYRADESTEGQVHAYTLNDDYWDPSAQGVERIEVYDIPDEQARINALRTDQVDLISVGGSGAAEIEADGNLTIIQRGYATTFGVPILDRDGTVVEALANTDVRHAMSLAIDRDAFVEAVSFGRAEPNIQPAPPGHWAHNDELDERIEYNPDRARELLAGAGYPDGFSFTMPSIPPFAAAIEVMGEFWRDIGIDVEVEAIEPGTLAGRSRTTDFPATMLNWVTGSDMSIYAPTYLTEDATFNPFGVPPNDRVLELVEQGSASTEIAERAPAYHELAEIIVDELPVIYIASPEALLGASSELAENPTLEFAAGQSEAPIWHGLRLDG